MLQMASPSRRNQMIARNTIYRQTGTDCLLLAPSCPNTDDVNRVADRGEVGVTEVFMDRRS